VRVFPDVQIVVPKPVFDRQIVTSRDQPTAMLDFFFARPWVTHINNRAKEYPARHELSGCYTEWPRDDR
jgi:hypothetical protein